MEIFKKYKAIWIILIAVVIVVSVGVTIVIKGIFSGKFYADSFSEKGAIENSTLSSWNKSYSYLNGHITKGIKVKDGEELTINYSSEVKEGSLKIVFINEEDKEVKNLIEDNSGVFKYTAKSKGTCHIQVIGDKTKGQFNLSWK
ncbi:hypothetical protein [Clostridium fungisolvens]|uniref:Uncharacterized protein n=1 Tax=Clostridium fungisolvens TaxID=1604897 RepID=A0A6V8SMF7_9CLOT|nr:hypothetical protein [Clostridium fungisolvens]GFP77732.1 hypothetical protein bsdtw1_03903 [Clostridium fungisolvens]